MTKPYEQVTISAEALKAYVATADAETRDAIKSNISRCGNEFVVNVYPEHKFLAALQAAATKSN